jgi:putative DNA primase/helicase
MDVLAAFLEECCVFHKRAEADASELYRAYTRWCDDSGEHAETQKSFGTRLRERGLTSRKAHRSTIWRGIGLAADDADHADLFSPCSHEKKSQRGKPGNGSAPSASSADGEVF